MANLAPWASGLLGSYALDIAVEHERTRRVLDRVCCDASEGGELARERRAQEISKIFAKESCVSWDPLVARKGVERLEAQLEQKRQGQLIAAATSPRAISLETTVQLEMAAATASQDLIMSSNRKKLESVLVELSVSSIPILSRLAATNAAARDVASAAASLVAVASNSSSKQNGFESGVLLQMLSRPGHFFGGLRQFPHAVDAGNALGDGVTAARCFLATAEAEVKEPVGACADLEALRRWVVAAIQYWDNFKQGYPTQKASAEHMDFSMKEASDTVGSGLAAEHKVDVPGWHASSTNNFLVQETRRPIATAARSSSAMCSTSPQAARLDAESRGTIQCSLRPSFSPRARVHSSAPEQPEATEMRALIPRRTWLAARPTSPRANDGLRHGTRAARSRTPAQVPHVEPELGEEETRLLSEQTRREIREIRSIENRLKWDMSREEKLLAESEEREVAMDITNWRQRQSQKLEACAKESRQQSRLVKYEQASSFSELRCNRRSLAEALERKHTNELLQQNKENSEWKQNIAQDHLARSKELAVDARAEQQAFKEVCQSQKMQSRAQHLRQARMDRSLELSHVARELAKERDEALLSLSCTRACRHRVGSPLAGRGGQSCLAKRRKAER